LIRGSDSGAAEDSSLVGLYAVSIVKYLPTFRKTVARSSSGSSSSRRTDAREDI